MEVDDVTTQCTLLAGQLHIVHPCFDMQNGGYQWLPLVFDLLLSIQTHVKSMASSRITRQRSLLLTMILGRLKLKGSA